MLCQTVYEMTAGQLVSLNDEHKSYQGTDENRGVDPHWVERLKCQAKLFASIRWSVRRSLGTRSGFIF